MMLEGYNDLNLPLDVLVGLNLFTIINFMLFWKVFGTNLTKSYLFFTFMYIYVQDFYFFLTNRS